MKFKVGLKIEGAFPSGADTEWVTVCEGTYDAIVRYINTGDFKKEGA